LYFTRGFLLALVLLLYAYGAAGAVKEESAEPIVAEVNRVPITVRDLEQAVSEIVPRISGHRRLSEGRMKELRLQALKGLIEQELVIQEARRLRLTVEREAIEAELSKIRGRFSSDRAYREGLVSEGLTPEKVQRGVERYLLVQRAIRQEVEERVSIPEEELERYYQDHREQFILPEQVRLRQILVRVDPNAASGGWDKAYRRALHFVEEAKSGKDFAELAREFSDDVQTKEAGGDLGFVHRGQMRVGAVEERAYSLEIGKISEPIRTLYGYFIIRVEDRRPQRQLEFKEVNRPLLRNELHRSAMGKRREEWLKGLRERAEIKIFESQ
jgi:parvulin-like peptidyl-prolyl isomerase